MPSIPINVKRDVNEAIIEIVLEALTARTAGIPACRFSIDENRRSDKRDTVKPQRQKRVHDKLSFPRLVLVPLSRAVDCLLPGNPRCTEYALPPPPPPQSTYNPFSEGTHRHSPPINFLRAPSDIHPLASLVSAACSPHQEPSTG
ncbi:hypothetical protein K0M31_016109 [Melipona bicolor]|uniref:Uncharacterized protein n=1 Tax=Melipona bicolor TaxID=60889 RepID=A0AA40KTD2_9HYME|nr:hypothetical protein K0M31_016109 [Melipona bicolor]